MSNEIVLCVLTSGETRNPIGSVAPDDMLIAVGFGSAGVYQDGALVLDGEDPPEGYRDEDGCLTVRHAEQVATELPLGVWEIRIDAPLWSAVWRRAEPGKWVCVEAGQGFA